MAMVPEGFCQELVDIYRELDDSTKEIPDVWKYALKLWLERKGYYDEEGNKTITYDELPKFQEMLVTLYKVARRLDDKKVRNSRKAISICEEVLNGGGKTNIPAEAKKEEARTG